MVQALAGGTLETREVLLFFEPKGSKTSLLVIVSSAFK